MIGIFLLRLKPYEIEVAQINIEKALKQGTNENSRAVYLTDQITFWHSALLIDLLALITIQTFFVTI